MDRMASYRRAFALRALKPWHSLNERQVFGLRTGDALCYVQVLGTVTEDFGLAVYRGDEDLARLMRVFRYTGNDDTETEIAACSQNSLLCQYCTREMMEDDEIGEVRAAAQACGVVLRGVGAWPKWLRMTPLRPPARITEDGDFALLDSALDAACWLVTHKKDKDISVPMLSPDGGEILCLRPEGGAYAVETCRTPALEAPVYPEGHTDNEVQMARVKKLPSGGVWACKVTIDHVFSHADGVTEMVIPWRLLTVDLDSGEPIDVRAVRDYETRTGVMLEQLMNAMIDREERPSEILVSDARTRALLASWCAAMKIPFTEGEEPEEITDMEGFGNMDREDMEESTELMLDMLLEMPIQELTRQRGPLSELHETLEDLLDGDEVPARIRGKAQALLDRLQRIDKRKASPRTSRGRKKAPLPDISYVISVSLGAGCYRHIRISGHETLEALSDAILRAFHFDNDHLHAFFMDNRLYGRVGCYYSEAMEDEEGPTTAETTLLDAGLVVGMKFKYLFDFGDEWVFQCRVLRQTDEPAPRAAVVRTVGTAPEQYPSWDDEDWSWDDEDDGDEDGGDEDGE